MNAEPKTLVYADALAAVERQIVEALPEIVEGLIAKAREGDVKAAVYLTDRILGKTAGSVIAPANDRRPPYTEEDFALDLEDRERDRYLRSMLSPTGARKGA